MKVHRVRACSPAWLPWLVAAIAACGEVDAPTDASPRTDGVVGDAALDAAPAVDAAVDAAADAAADAALDAPDPLAAQTLLWTRCHRSFFCADVRVPLDHARPAGESITVRVLRAPARRPADRLGVLFVNYGGPGVPTVERVAEAYPAVLGSAIGADVADRFDVVAVDWRGLGGSAPTLGCRFARADDPLAAEPPEVLDDAGWAAYLRQMQASQQACLTSVSREFLARVSSDDAARDLDRVRALLGESQVSFVGYSYGTRLGASYLALFPERVRAAVLDGPLNPGASFRDQVLGQARGFQSSFARFFAWCARSEGCALEGRAEGAEALSRRFDALVARLDAAPLRVGKRLVRGEHLLGELVGASYVPEAGWPAAAEHLALAARGNGGALLRSLDEGWSDDVRRSGYYAIRALDTPAAADETPERFRAFLQADVAAVGRHMPRLFAEEVGYVGWPVRRPDAPAPLGTSVAPTLIVAGRHDPATPFENAAPLRDALAGRATVLTYEGDGHAVSNRVPCVAGLTWQWLEDPSIPLVQTTCPAGPL